MSAPSPRTGAGGCCLLSGEAGLGKTALVRATYRDDGLHREHPLRIALGELAVTQWSASRWPAHGNARQPGRAHGQGAGLARPARRGPAQRRHRGAALHVGAHGRHHVSAILRKPGVQSRGQASAEAARLRIVQR